MSVLAAHRRALLVIALAVALDVALGVAFGYADGIAAWDGLYFATTTATTVGYGDITPHGWAAHVLAVLMMTTVIPLVGAAFSLFTSGLTTLRVHASGREAARARAEAEHARQIAADTYRHLTGHAHPRAPVV